MVVCGFGDGVCDDPRPGTRREDGFRDGLFLRIIDCFLVPRGAARRGAVYAVFSNRKTISDFFAFIVRFLNGN
jgi:hypothetical protein